MTRDVETEHVTRNWWGWKIATTARERPTRFWIRWWDLALLAAFLLFVPYDAPDWVFIVGAVVLFVLWPCLWAWRANEAARACKRLGHVPYLPVPEVPTAIFCERCDAFVEGPLEPPALLAMEARAAAMRETQAQYSDRR